MAEPRPTKAANIMANIFVALIVILAIVQIGVAVFSDVHWLVKVLLGIFAFFFLIVIVFLIIEKRKEPPIKY